MDTVKTKQVVILLNSDKTGFIDIINLSRELFTHGKALVPYAQLSINCGLNNFITVQILFSLYYNTILQLVDNCTNGTIAFPCIKSSLH